MAPILSRQRRDDRTPRAGAGDRFSSAAVGAAVGVTLMVVALRCLGHPALVAAAYHPPRPDVAAWAVGSAAIAMLGGAQLVFVLFVLGRLYRRGAFDRLLILVAWLVLAGGASCAIAFAFGSR